MITLDAVLRIVGELDETELSDWIARHWVRPEPSPTGFLFRDVDVARIRLIVEMQRECAFDEETLPVVLSLLDQVYRLRRQLQALSDAVTREPDEVQARILGALSSDA